MWLQLLHSVRYRLLPLLTSIFAHQTCISFMLAIYGERSETHAVTSRSQPLLVRFSISRIKPLGTLQKHTPNRNRRGRLFCG